MKKILRIVLTTLFFIFSIPLMYGWGGWGHRHINRAAVFSLPEEMRAFYYNHIDFITEGAVVPDLRRGLLNDRAETPRHFIDIEDFKNTSIDALPRTMKEAYAKYDSAFLQKTGILPWYIQSIMDKLTTAFKRKNRSEIIFLSAELGHYVGDAHMPLHTASNYNGQLSNQKGVHALWESTIPEVFGNTYNFNVAEAKYIDDVTAETWHMIGQSHDLELTLLAADKKVRSTIAPDQMYKKDAAGKNVLAYNEPVFSTEYATQFHTALNGMVEKQMRLSVIDVANYWYTAWVNGGKPDLALLDDPSLTKRNKKNYKKELKAWNSGRLLNLNLSGD